MAGKNNFIAQVDKLIGNKIYQARIVKAISRKELAQLTKISTYQITKHEKGINRISTGRLVLLAKALQEDISYFSYFYNSIPSTNIELVSTPQQLMCFELATNFMNLQILNNNRQFIF